MRAPRLENMLWRSQMEKQGQAVWELWTDESLPNRSDQIGHIPALVHSPILGSSSEPLPGVEPVALNPRTWDSKVCIYTNTTAQTSQGRGLGFLTLFRFSLNLRHVVREVQR